MGTASYLKEQQKLVSKCKELAKGAQGFLGPWFIFSYFGLIAEVSNSAHLLEVFRSAGVLQV